MVATDTNKNLNRIANTLLADEDVFDKGKTTGKARKIVVYDRPGDEPLDESMKPFIYVTTRDSLQTTKRDFGVTSPDSVNVNNLEYEIVIISDSLSTSRAAQKQMYDILKATRTALEADPKFPTPGTPGDDEVFSRSIISEVTINPGQRGKLSVFASIILLVSVGSNFQLEFPDSGLIIDIRSENRNKGRNSTKIANDEGNTKTSKGEYVGTSFYEYDYDATIFNQIDTLIEADNEIPVNLIDGIITTPLIVKPVFQNVTKPTIDAVKTVLITLEESTA